MCLVVEQRVVRLAGQNVRALTYNGDYMPPTIRLRPGDQLDLTLVNRLGEHTNLHTHGWYVSPGGNSDNIYLHIMPGQTFHYTYRLPKDLAPGTYWYHSHAHPVSEPQVFAGLSGAIVIDGLNRYLPPGLRNIGERLIALKDFQVHGGAIPTTNINSDAPTTRTVNGLVNPIMNIRPVRPSCGGWPTSAPTSSTTSNCRVCASTWWRRTPTPSTTSGAPRRCSCHRAAGSTCSCRDPQPAAPT
ncbi:Multicopper oxidase [Streptosporangium subroseum]|uniref:Multicopper oxidase n=1 Tax=Streptosporangium subroseum TaxID=106412 RepID=A0A239PED8_9ACTN|nr:Multicopper oxidase [Streptosporangium subroseum]